jgi:hypothetical protein
LAAREGKSDTGIKVWLHDGMGVYLIGKVCLQYEPFLRRISSRSIL